MKRSIVIFLSFLFIANLFADSSGDLKLSKPDNANPFLMKFRGDVTLGTAYYPPHQSGVKSSNRWSNVTTTKLDYTDLGDANNLYHSAGDPGRVINSGLGGYGGLEGKFYINYSMIAPFLRGDHFLINNNSITLRLKSELTLVSWSNGAEIEISPIAFLLFNSGFFFGTGWDASAFSGMGRNNALGLIKDKPKEFLKESFYGVVFNSWFSATFQFDIAALAPKPYKRWTHFIMKFSPQFEYVGLMNVSDSQAFDWEAQGYSYLNGWYLSGSYVIGYQIPVIQDNRKEEAEKKTFMGYVKHNDFKISLLMWMEINEMHLTHYFDSQMKDGGWGSDFVPLRFGPNIMFNLPSNFMLMIGCHFTNKPAYSSETVGNLAFSLRKYEDWYTNFNRIVVAFGWNY